LDLKQRLPALDVKQWNKAAHLTNRLCKAYLASTDAKKEQTLSDRLHNVVYHIFDHHQGCQKEFCSLYPALIKPKHLKGLIIEATKLSKVSENIANNYNTNICECFVAQVAMFLNGRRVNFGRREDVIRRVTLAGLTFCSGKYRFNCLQFFAKKNEKDLSSDF
jgi:hypothetical protein